MGVTLLKILLNHKNLDRLSKHCDYLWQLCECHLNDKNIGRAICISSGSDANDEGCVQGVARYT